MRWLLLILLAVALEGCGGSNAVAPSSTEPAATPAAVAPPRTERARPVPQLLALRGIRRAAVVGQLQGWRVLRHGSRLLAGRSGARPRPIGRRLDPDARPEVGTDAAGRTVVATWRGTPGATTFWLLDLRRGVERQVPVALGRRRRVLAVTVSAGRLVYADTAGDHPSSSLWTVPAGGGAPRRLLRRGGTIGELDSGPRGLAYVVTHGAGEAGATMTIHLARPGRPDRTVDAGGGGVMEGSYDVGSPTFAGRHLIWLGADGYAGTSDLYRLDLATNHRHRLPMPGTTLRAVAADDDHPTAPLLVTANFGSDEDPSAPPPSAAELRCRRCW